MELEISDISMNLKTVKQIVTKAHEASSFSHLVRPRLVAVSKTKPISDILETYAAGQRHFGENYVQELVEKSQSPIITEKCPEIRWHFIGNLQSNKVNKLLQAKNLFLLETLDSEKLATGLQRALSRNDDVLEHLNVFVQVNTSGEDQKNGILPEKAPTLVKFILENCDRLKFMGLMTIGSLSHSRASADENVENPDFVTLRNTRASVIKEIGLTPAEVELSMGMSTDYVEAIKSGSTNVRVGSAIFGARATVKP